MKLLAKCLDDSSCAAARVGPKMRSPAPRNASTMPLASGASGPITVSAMFSRRQNHGGCARLGERIEPVAEGKEGVGGHSGAGERKPGALRFQRRDAHAVNAAHLPGADAERRAAAAEDNGIGLHELGDAPGKGE